MAVAWLHQKCRLRVLEGACMHVHARACALMRARGCLPAYRHSIKANPSIILRDCDSQQACTFMSVESSKVFHGVLLTAGHQHFGGNGPKENITTH